MNWKIKWYISAILVSFLLEHQSKAQGVLFCQNSCDSLFKVAETQNQMLFVDLYADWCAPCKTMEKMVFTNESVGAYFNKEFLNIRVNVNHDFGKWLIEKYHITEFPTYLFLNHENGLVYKIIGYQSINNLSDEAKKASQIWQKFIPLKQLDQNFAEGNRNQNFLYEYIKRKNTETGPQPELLDAFLQSVPKSELRTEKVLEVISANCKSVKSTAFQVLVESLSRFQSMTEMQQKAILSGISNSKKETLRKAIQEKDDELFNVLIDAVYQTAYSRESAFAEERQLRYDFAKHTSNFKFFKIIAEEEAMNILQRNPEDYQQETQQTIEEFKAGAVSRGISANSSQYNMILAGLENGASRLASYQLNDFARGYYLMADKTEEFKLALKWSAYSIKLNETAANWETYGLLLGKLGRKSDARKALKRAFKLGKTEKPLNGSLKEYLKSKL